MANPKPSSEVRRPHKKSVNFRNDPEILQRLAKVGELLLENKTAPEIAAAMQQPLGTTQNDIKRVRLLWKEEAKEDLGISRTEALLTYRKVMRAAWDKVKDVANLASADRFLTVILRAQARIDKISGLEVEHVEVSGPEGGPIEIDKIRAKRWKQIAPQLQEVADGHEQ